MIAKLAILTVVFASAMCAISYRYFAEPKGWPVGRIYHDPGSHLRILGMLAAVAAPIVSLIFLPWWSVAVVVVAGECLAYLCTIMLGPRIQLVVPVTLVGSWVACIVWFLP